MFWTVIGIIFCTLFLCTSLANTTVFAYSYAVDILFKSAEEPNIGSAILFVVMLVALIAQAIVFALHLFTSLVMNKKCEGKPRAYARLSIILTSVLTFVFALVTVLTYVQLK